MALKKQFGARVIAQLNAIPGAEHVAPLPAAQFVAKRAREYAPVDTGYMRDHIHAKKQGDGAAMISEAFYSGYVEWGTRYMAAQPFLRPAIADGRREIPKITAKEVNAEIRRRISKA
jgi:HK97 gp10 family phage protein